MRRTSAPENCRRRSARFNLRVYFQNNHNRSVRLAVKYQAVTGGWAADGWWTLKPGQKTLLATQGRAIQTLNNTVYCYAEVMMPGVNWSWKGTESQKFGGRTLPMRRQTLNVDADGDFVLLIC